VGESEKVQSSLEREVAERKREREREDAQDEKEGVVERVQSKGSVEVEWGKREIE
jgi:hypothetical protein